VINYVSSIILFNFILLLNPILQEIALSIVKQIKDTDLGQPLSLITCDSKEGYKITEEGANFLQSINEEIGVICVAGKYRTGMLFR
jgi:hypothetical protein